MKFIVSRKEFEALIAEKDALVKRVEVLEAELKSFTESPAVRELLSLCREV